MGLCNAGQHTVSADTAYAAGHAPVIAQCILQNEAYHASLYFTSILYACQISIRFAESLLSVIVVRIDHQEG